MLPARFKQHPFIERLAARVFSLTGHPYPSRWYTPYKFRELKRVLSRPFYPNRLPENHGRWLDERIVEYPWVFSRLPAGPGRLLDAGSAINFDFLLQQPGLREKEITIFTLAPEADCFWHYGVSYVYGDLRRTAFRDDYFDSIVSISTLEHVGLDNTLLYTKDASKKEADTAAHLAAVHELRRILKPGGSACITLPFGRHEVRNWLQIFDAAMLDALIDTFRPEAWSADFFRYRADKGWQFCSREAARDARYFDPRTDHPWPGRPVGAESVVCLELRK